MNEIKTATIGKGKAVHALFGVDRTLCKRNANADSALPVECDADEVTCKKCLKEIAAEVEQAHGEAIEENAAREAETTTLMTDVEEAYAAAIVENAHLYGAHLARWRGADGKNRFCDVRVPMVGLPWRDQKHEGPCFDAVKGEWFEAPTLTPKQRRAARRALRATVKRMTAETRAAARARRTRRGAARATAKTLLVAAGMPQDVVERYAPAFSRGVQAPTVATRHPLPGHRSKRVEVKRYTWQQFTERLAVYRPANHLAHLQFEKAASWVRKLQAI